MKFASKEIRAKAVRKYLESTATSQQPAKIFGSFTFNITVDKKGGFALGILYALRKMDRNEFDEVCWQIWKPPVYIYIKR